MSRTNYPKINSERLWQRHMEMAAIGATKGGGVHRLALTPEDIEAHVLLVQWAEARGFTCALDPMGNMFIRREGSDPSLPPVTSGSHTDTQRYAGRFDGITGVLTAFEALETIDEAGIETRHPLEVAIWNNEEGARYTPACMGSAAYVGFTDLEDMLARTDEEQITMGSCVENLVKALPQAASRDIGSPIAFFLESHIEQGVRLEASGNIIGAVTGMQGYRRFAVEVIGEDAHSGTTPRARRKDAFVAATDMTRALRDVLWDDEDEMRYTIGTFEVLPGGTSVVPGQVNFLVDLRYHDKATLDRLAKEIPEILQAHAGPCELRIVDTFSVDPMEFPEEIVASIEAAAERHDLGHERMYSYAGHDARHIARIAPAGMLFIPCWKGISHNEAERTEPEHVAAAAQVISDILIDRATS
ncbi:MAG: M20 family metallo-hydrolase [Pseudomonadota bacterium]